MRALCWAAGSHIFPWRKEQVSSVGPLLLGHSSSRALPSWPYFSSVQFSRSVVSDSATPWTSGRQASLSITNSQSLPKLMSIESVMPSNHLILCRPLLLLPSIFPNIRVFSNESVLRIRWSKYWSFSSNISPSNEHPGLILRMAWLDLLAVQGTRSVTGKYSWQVQIHNQQASANMKLTGKCQFVIDKALNRVLLIDFYEIQRFIKIFSLHQRCPNITKLEFNLNCEIFGPSLGSNVLPSLCFKTMSSTNFLNCDTMQFCKNMK